MRFQTTTLSGVWLMDLDPHKDDRGFFVRTYCEREFEERGLNTRWPQCNLTMTSHRGSVRGMHYQAEPSPEIKLVRCAAGSIYDVLVDLRPDSPTFRGHEAFELTSRHHQQLYVPAGVAHGFQCLEDGCQVFYQMSAEYVAHLARGIRYNDPRVGIAWPLPVVQVSERDRALPLLGP